MMLMMPALGLGFRSHHMKCRSNEVDDAGAWSGRQGNADEHHGAGPWSGLNEMQGQFIGYAGP